MVKGAVYVLLHPCKDNCGVRMQLCEDNSPDECDQYSCVMHGGHCNKITDDHKDCEITLAYHL